MNIINFALQLEVEGEDFYRGLAKKTQNKGIKKIFKMLADDEMKHYETINKMRSTLNITLKETAILKNARNIFEEAKKNREDFVAQTDTKELWQKAQELEKKSEDFYLQKAKEVPKEEQKELFSKLANEEKKHYFLIENMIEFLSRPMSWIENAEFNHLEEY